MHPLERALLSPKPSKPAAPTAPKPAVVQPIVHPIPASVIPELIRWRMEAERRYLAKSLQRNMPKKAGK
jgi:hypothetical protein